MNDLLITDSADLQLENADFVIADSTLQNQALILMVNPAEFKEYPTLGVGIESYILDSDMSACEFEARKQFTLDGMKVKKLDFTDPDNLIINAQYQ